MTIVLNGEERAVPDGVTVAALLDSLGLPRAKVAVERNRAIVSRSRFADQVLAAGDEIEIVRFVGGG